MHLLEVLLLSEGLSFELLLVRMSVGLLGELALLQSRVHVVLDVVGQI